MSARRRRSFFDQWYDTPAKQPAPANGIAATRFGDTWWGREWIASLERLGRLWSNRLARGRTYARAGRVVDLEVGAGIVTAGVVGTRSKPYRVEITLPQLAPDVWRRAVDDLTADTLLVIRLLNRELPDEVGARLRTAGIELFPSCGELATICSCPDVANPCKHVAAVHYLFAAALDNDPFLLLRLRGLDRDGLVAAIAGDVEETAAPAARTVDGADRDCEEPAGDLELAAFLGRGVALPVLEIEPRAPTVELVGLKRLGPPPRGLEALVALLTPTIRAAGKLALELAWDDTAILPETRDDECPPPPSVQRRRGRRPKDLPAPTPGRPAPSAPVQVLSRPTAPSPDRGLVTLVEQVLGRARRPLSKRELVAALRADPGDVTTALKGLRAARLVTSHGRGPATRYALSSVAAQAGTPRRGRRPRRPFAADPAGRIVEILRTAGTPTTLRDLADSLGAAADALRPTLLALRQNGVVEMVGRRRNARYRLVQ